jgi:acetaldehyde dehydrogenase (acetylating)
MNKTSLIIVVLGLVILTTTMCTKKEKDTTAPVIVLDGANPQYVARDSVYVEPGYTANDDVDGDITNLVKVKDDIDIHTEGTYHRKYNVTDASGNTAQEQIREVRVMVF